MRKNTRGMGGRRKGAMKRKATRMAKPAINTNAPDDLTVGQPKLPKLKGVKF